MCTVNMSFKTILIAIIFEGGGTIQFVAFFSIPNISPTLTSPFSFRAIVKLQQKLRVGFLDHIFCGGTTDMASIIIACCVTFFLGNAPYDANMGDIIFLFKFLRVHIRNTIKTGNQIKILAEESISYWVLDEKTEVCLSPLSKKGKVSYLQTVFLFPKLFWMLLVCYCVYWEQENFRYVRIFCVSFLIYLYPPQKTGGAGYV